MEGGGAATLGQVRTQEENQGRMHSAMDTEDLQGQMAVSENPKH